MGEAEREKMERQVLGEICGPDCLLDYGQNIDGSRKEVDGWIMPVIELERVRDMRNDMVTTQHDYFSIDEGDPCTPIDPSHLWCALPFRAVITY
jgi:midasin